MENNSILKPYGQLYYANELGVLPRVGEAPKGIWADYAADAVAQLKEHCGDNLISVSLRGTSARNATIDGSSDLDLIVLTKTALEADPELSLRHAPHVPVDIYATSKDAFMNGAQEAWLRFNLTHSGFVIWGEQVLSALPDPSLNQDAIGHMRDLDQWYAAWPTYFDEEENDADKKDICAWLMKRLVRGAFEAVMFKEMAYSRDIYPCVQTAIKYVPQHEHDLVRAAELVIEPTADKAEIEFVAAAVYGLLEAQRFNLA